MPPKASAGSSAARGKKGTRAKKDGNAELIKLIADQQTVLTSIVQTLATTASAPGATGPPPTKIIQLPKLCGPETLSIPQFKDWKQRWGDYEAAQQLNRHSVTTQQGILRSALDSEWTLLWTSGRLQIQAASTLQEIINLLEQYLRKKRNPLLDRQAFIRRDQADGESVDRYFAALKTLDDACAHEDAIICNTCAVECVTECPSCNTRCSLPTHLQDIRLRDRLICGLRDKEMQKKVLAEQYSSTLTLEKILSICIAIENSNFVGDTISSDISPHTEANVARSTYKKQQRLQSKATTEAANDHQSTEVKPCYWCGKKERHRRSKCPARNGICDTCGLKGHFASVCRSKDKTAQSATGNPVQLDVHAPASAPTINIVSCHTTSKLLPIPTVINGIQTIIQWLADTGSDVDILSHSTIRQMGPKVQAAMTSEKLEVIAANGLSLGPVISVQARLLLNGRALNTTIRVYENATNPLLSRKTCIGLGLIEDNWPFSRLSARPSLQAITTGTPHTVTSSPIIPSVETLKQQLINEHHSVFDDSNLRTMDGPPMKIELIDGAIPFKRYKAHAIPFHWREKVRHQLETMISNGIVEPVPVGEAVDWCHPMVVVPKKGTDEPRITVDLTGLNPFVRRPAYPVQVPREVVARIPAGNRFFTTLDARHGYWQIPLDEQSKKLTTFITPWGCFRYTRNVMGLISEGDEHNRRGDEALKGISNVEKIVEDILIYDKDLDTHVQRVREVLERCQLHGITLNLKKFKFALPEIEWCGFRLTTSGYSPAPHLTHALTKFPVPTNKTDVRSFCGLVQQFEAFSNKITELSAPLRSLLSNNAVFRWEEFHQRAFEALITELKSPRVLTHFIPGRKLRLQTDAAQSRGLGFALWQQEPSGDKWKLVQTGSRFVTPTESRYSATEIELLAVCWATKKCRLFLLGQPFELIVDHRPLIPIINSKTLDEIENSRLQRLKQKLSIFRPQAIWRAGTKHTVVDVFSRYPSSDPDDEDIQDDLDSDMQIPLVAALHDLQDGTPILDDQILLAMKDATDLSSECERLKQFIRRGFPDTKHKLDEDLRSYWQYRDQLSIQDDIILLGTRILVPKVLRRSVLETLHSSHQGQVRTIGRARQAVFWPGLNNDIINMVRSCPKCASYLPSQQKEPLMSDVFPTRPFQHTSADLFSHAGYEYLVYTDRYSGWINVAKCGSSATSRSVINQLKKWMVDLGIPEILKTDNGPQFSSFEFKSWTKLWGIKHETSSPHYPQSNGLAESAVKAAKYLLGKSTTNGDIESEAFQMGLLELRNTPRADGLSPAQLLFGMPMRTKLPLHRSHFDRRWRDVVSRNDQASTRLREKAAEQYNQNSRPMSLLRAGDVVRVQNPSTHKWDTIGEVIEINPRKRSYAIRTESGSIYRRNRRFLRPFSQQTNGGESTAEHAISPSPRRSSRHRRAPDRYSNAVSYDHGSYVEGGHVVYGSDYPRQNGASPNRSPCSRIQSQHGRVAFAHITHSLSDSQ